MLRPRSHFASKSISLRWTLVALIALGTLALAPPTRAADEPNRRPPTFANISYGPHERNVLDLWQAESDQPTPLLIFIHGGGFVQGDKKGIHKNPAVRKALDAGVSFATINYRFREHAPLQDILRDAARAIQYIRSRAAEWNIDPARIASYGSSAGAGTSMWLAFHDDLADPAATDPVLRQSSRLVAAGSLDGQASYDLRDWEAIVGASPYQREAAELLKFYDFDSTDEAATPEADRIMKDCSMIGLISQDDPPVVIACAIPNEEPASRGDYVHHPKHSIALAERCKANGVECRLILHDETAGDRPRQASLAVDFLLEKLKRPAAK
jgi:acetyl esterase/lipase